MVLGNKNDERKLRNQSIKDENMRRRCASKKKKTQGKKKKESDSGVAFLKWLVKGAGQLRKFLIS